MNGYLLTLAPTLIYIANKIERELVATPTENRETSKIRFIVTSTRSPTDRIVLRLYREVMSVIE